MIGFNLIFYNKMLFSYKNKLLHGKKKVLIKRFSYYDILLNY
jgi:hypothetical protein